MLMLICLLGDYMPMHCCTHPSCDMLNTVEVLAGEHHSTEFLQGCSYPSDSRSLQRDEEQASAVFLTELAMGLRLYAPGLISTFCVDWSLQILRAVTSTCCFYGCVVHFQLFAQDDSTHADSVVFARTPWR